MKRGVINETFCLDGYSLCHPEKNKGSILRAKRLALGLTQQQVANLAKISYCQYQRFESGERNMMTASFPDCLQSYKSS